MRHIRPRRPNRGDRHRQVQFELLVEIGLAGGGTKEVTDPGDDGMKQRAHASALHLR